MENDTKDRMFYILHLLLNENNNGIISEKLKNELYFNKNSLLQSSFGKMLKLERKKEELKKNNYVKKMKNWMLYHLIKCYQLTLAYVLTIHPLQKK